MEEIEREIDLEPQYYRPFLETARSIFDDEVYALVHEALRLAVDRLKGMAATTARRWSRIRSIRR